MSGATLIVGLAMLLMAVAGPGSAVRPGASAEPASAPAGGGNQRQTAVRVLRMVAAVLGLALLLFSAMQLWHSHR